MRAEIRPIIALSSLAMFVVAALCTVLGVCQEQTTDLFWCGTAVLWLLWIILLPYSISMWREYRKERAKTKE